MKKRELEMYKIKEIVEAIIQGRPIKSIARRAKISKNTVKKYRNIYEKIINKNNSIKDNIELIMKEFNSARKLDRYSLNFGWLKNNNELLNEMIIESKNYNILIEQLKNRGFKGSYSSLLRYINKTNIFNNEKPAMRIETKPGEIAQVDFGSVGLIWDETTKKKIKAYVFVMTLGFSRHSYYEIVKNQKIETWCNCHIHAFQYFNGVVKTVIPDNLKSAVIKASFLDPILNNSYKDLAKHYSFQVDPCLPGTPEHKGKVESGVKYVKNNFIPFKNFFNFADANKQLSEWNETKAKLRIHGTTRKMPIELFNRYEKNELTSLPNSFFEIPIYKNLKVYRDIHIQFDKAYYSVPYEYNGKNVLARKTASQMTIFYENKLIATHIPVEPGKRSTNNDHLPKNQYKYIKEDKDYCLNQAQKIGNNTHIIIRNMLITNPLRNLRGAQNVLRLSKKYGKERLENACKRAVFFGNNNYYSIKSILEKAIDKQLFLFFDLNKNVIEKKLNDKYAKNLKEYLTEVIKRYGNNNAIEN